MEMRYNIPEPAIGDEVWCCVGLVLADHDRVISNDALTQRRVVNLKQWQENGGVNCDIYGYENPYWVLRKYSGDFFATADGIHHEWYRYICPKAYYVPSDLELTIRRSYTMPDDEYNRRYERDLKAFLEAHGIKK